MINNYTKPFQITKNIGNNVFCFNKSKKSEIHIPNLIKTNISDFQNNMLDYIKTWDNTAFREEKNWEIIEYKGLQNFIEINWDKENLNQNIYIFDNHNHALYFRYKEYFKWNISKWISLIHIDQHTDMNENKFTIASKIKQSVTIEDIFQFTNYNCNVWNFIKPGVEEWLIWNIIQINTEYSLLKNTVIARNEAIQVLDIDLDFRAPEMSIQKYQETIEITKNLIKNSRVVTIATSPYFLNQNLAIKIIKDLFQQKKSR